MYKIYLILIFLVLRITIYNNTIIFLIFNCTATSLFCMHEMHDTPNLRRGISCFLTRFILLPNSRLRAYRYETMETARSRLAASVSSGHAWGCRRSLFSELVMHARVSAYRPHLRPFRCWRLSATVAAAYL
jgi:hypothetical protein